MLLPVHIPENFLLSVADKYGWNVNFYSPSLSLRTQICQIDGSHLSVALDHVAEECSAPLFCRYRATCSQVCGGLPVSDLHLQLKIQIHQLHDVLNLLSTIISLIEKFNSNEFSLLMKLKNILTYPYAMVMTDDTKTFIQEYIYGALGERGLNFTWHINPEEKRIYRRVYQEESLAVIAFCLKKGYDIEYEQEDIDMSETMYEIVSLFKDLHALNVTL